jgi:hypothetical protein
MYLGNKKTRVGAGFHTPLLTRYQNPPTAGNAGMRQEAQSAVYRHCPDGVYDFFEDFDEDTAITGEPESPYTEGAGSAAIVQGGRCGLIRLACTTGNSQQIGGYYRNDYTTVDARYGGYFECRFQVRSDVAANQRIIIGLASALVLPFSGISRYAWVKLNGSMAVTCESNDGTHVNTAQATNYTLVSGTALSNFYTVGVYFDDQGHVDFLIADSYGGGTGQLIALPGLTYTADSTLLQPFVMVMKDSGAVAMSMDVDFVRAGCRRV